MPLSLFSITVKEYENIRFDTADAGLLQIIIWGFCIGALLAALLSLYQQNVPGKLVRTLLRADAHTEETAKTLDELGLAGRRLIIRELRRGAALQKFVHSASEGEGQGSTSPEAESTATRGENAPTPYPSAADCVRYYIPQELKYRAETRYEKKGSGLISLLLTILLLPVMAVLLMKLIPVVLSMIDAIL